MRIPPIFYLVLFCFVGRPISIVLDAYDFQTRSSIRNRDKIHSNVSPAYSLGYPNNRNTHDRSLTETKIYKFIALLNRALII